MFLLGTFVFYCAHVFVDFKKHAFISILTSTALLTRNCHFNHKNLLYYVSSTTLTMKIKIARIDNEQNGQADKNSFISRVHVVAVLSDHLGRLNLPLTHLAIMYSNGTYDHSTHFIKQIQHGYCSIYRRGSYKIFGDSSVTLAQW